MRWTSDRAVYDGFGRLTSTTNDMSGTAKTLSYAYDARDLRTRITHPDGVYFTYDRDVLGHTVAIKENGTTTIVGDVYDVQGRRTSETRGAVTTSYGYDTMSRLSSLSDDLASTASDVTTTFNAYNPASQLLGRTRTNDLYAFGGYATVSRAYTVNGLNQYATAGTASFTYDDNGNLTSDGTVSYTYDIENRLLSGSGPVAATLEYDPLGRLWRMVTAVKTIEWLHDGDAVVAEYATVSQRFVHGDSEDDPLIWYYGSGLTDRRSLQADAQGSIVSTADAGGAAIGINSYDEYGIPAVGNLGRFEYTGQMYLGQLGMYYYKARMYSPTLGRFMQTDPIGYKDQNNLYAYVGNDPVDGRDPTGTQVRGTFYEDSGLVVVRDEDTGQILQASAFSGGESRGYYGAPIPVGDYAILQGKDENHYRLERLDNHFGDDRTPEGRSELRFHPHGDVSVGCITCHRGKGGDGIGGMLANTRKRTTTVDYNGRNPFHSSKESISLYGTMRVLSDGPYRLNKTTNAVSIVTSPAIGTRLETTRYLCTIQPTGVCKK